MLWLLVPLVLSMQLLWGCAAKHLPPSPVLGVDIVGLNKGDVAPFNGIEFSPYYLDQYLQWKNQ